MAAGSEVPEKRALEATGYTPSEYKATPVNVPTGAGALWAGVGATALGAAGQFQAALQQSPLNPLVKAKMDAGIEAARQGIAQSRAIANLPNNIGRTLIGVDAQGNAIFSAPAGIQDPTTAAAFQQALGILPKKGKGTTGPPPAVNNPAAPAAPDQGGMFLNPATGSYEALQQPGAAATQPAPAGTQPKAPAPPTTKEMGSASTDNDFALRQMMEERRAALGEAAPEGTPPALTFTNPATGNVQPLQQTAPSMFAGRAATPPAAPTVPSQPAPVPQPSTPGTVPGSLSDQYAQWQAQSMGQPMTADDAMAWMRRRTTLVQHATYMEHGGPGGSPAFAFGMKTPDGKSGGVNIVPVDQMVANGAGPSVASQNTSLVLSKSDQLKQQQQNALAVLPGMSQPATPMPSGTGVGAPQGPPAAPGLPPQQAYPTIASDQGGLQGAPGTSYNPVPYQQAVAQATANPQNLTAQTAPAGQPATVQPAPGQPINPLPSNDTVPQADQAAIQAKASQMAPPPSGEYQGDRVVPGTVGPYTYYVDDNPKSPWRGRIYTAMPGPAGHYFEQQKWYLGMPGYQNYELPGSAGQQQMWDKWGTKGYLTHAQIDAMSEKDMEPWLQRAWKNETFQRSDPIGEFNNTLDAAANYHNSLKKIADIEQTLAENGYKNLSVNDRITAAAVNAGTSLISRHPMEKADIPQILDLTGRFLKGEATTGKPGSMDPEIAAAIRTLDQEIAKAHGFLTDYHKGLLLNPGMGGGQETPNIHGSAINVGLPDIPNSDAILDSAWSGQDIKTRLAGISGLQEAADNRYRDLVSQGQNQWMRIDPKHDANLLNLDQHRDFNDPTNAYKGHTIPSVDLYNREDVDDFVKTRPPGRQFTYKGYTYQVQ